MLMSNKNSILALKCGLRPKDDSFFEKFICICIKLLYIVVENVLLLLLLLQKKRFIRFNFEVWFHRIVLLPKNKKINKEF